MMMQRSLLLLLVGAAASSMLEVVYFPIEATITFPEMAGKPSGTIKLSQASATDRTEISVDLTGLEGGNKWHVHVDAVPATGECSALATGGHFDPAGANYSSGAPRPPYEYGDLSGKHGKLNATSGSGGSFVRTGQAVVMDATLPLSGAYSVVGRSIVIHKVDGSRWTCADIVGKLCPDGCIPRSPTSRRLLFGTAPKPEPPGCPPGCGPAPSEY